MTLLVIGVVRSYIFEEFYGKPLAVECVVVFLGVFVQAVVNGGGGGGPIHFHSCVEQVRFYSAGSSNRRSTLPNQRNRRKRQLSRKKQESMV